MYDLYIIIRRPSGPTCRTFFLSSFPTFFLSSFLSFLPFFLSSELSRTSEPPGGRFTSPLPLPWNAPP